MFKLEILIHWIVPQQAKNHSEIDEEPYIQLGDKAFQMACIEKQHRKVCPGIGLKA
jgi:hypothetical protein